jgi:hypothetical protein
LRLTTIVGVTKINRRYTLYNCLIDFVRLVPDGGMFYSSCRLHGTSINLEDEDDLDDLDDEAAAQAAFVMVNKTHSSHTTRHNIFIAIICVKMLFVMRALKCFLNFFLRTGIW